ncbi:protein rep [Pseudonocardia sp. Ae717_Ps2]|uniref:protein rep n=1 Tax=Pseudonocardia sp. Ae717_Ps2 TaxID=1885573 RepID=UPI00094B4A5B|nr:protein rep [Pseudonocardia sp. Ae717_Ps2]
MRIGAKRAEEVATVLAHHLAEGGDPLLITLTMRHHRQHSLAECLKALTVAWGKVTQGRAAQDDYRMLGLRGWVRALEITHSVDNGWHVHLHIHGCRAGHVRRRDRGIDRRMVRSLVGRVGQGRDARTHRGARRRRAAR